MCASFLAFTLTWSKKSPFLPWPILVGGFVLWYLYSFLVFNATQPRAFLSLLWMMSLMSQECLLLFNHRRAMAFA